MMNPGWNRGAISRSLRFVAFLSNVTGAIFWWAEQRKWKLADQIELRRWAMADKIQERVQR
jgi:hypothetical protein